MTKAMRQPGGNYDNTLTRVSLYHAERELRNARRANRLGLSCYWDVREARKTFMRARMRMEESRGQRPAA